jgi:zinc resistance-associated protein
MWKAAVVGVGALALAGTTILMAQDRGGEGRRWMGPGMTQGDRDGPRGGGPGWHRFGGALVMGREHPRFSADDMRAFADARIAALRAGLALRPEQEKNWPPFEQALRAAAKDRIDRIQARQAARESDQQTQASDPIERLRRLSDAMSKRGAALKAIADAGAPLYQTLDDAQKNRFHILARFGRHHHMGWRHRFERRGEEENR